MPDRPPEFFAALTEPERESLREHGTMRRARRGEVLLAEGAAADDVIVVLSGHVKITVTGRDGREVLLGFRGPGALIGEQAMIDREPRSASAVALEDVEVLAVGSPRFRSFLVATPTAGMAIMALLSRRLRASSRRRAERLGADTLTRVAGRLVELAEDHGRVDAGGLRIAVPLDAADLAAWTGEDRGAVGRALDDLTRRGLVHTGDLQVVVRDVAALASLA